MGRVSLPAKVRINACWHGTFIYAQGPVRTQGLLLAFLRGLPFRLQSRQLVLAEPDNARPNFFGFNAIVKMI